MSIVGQRHASGLIRDEFLEILEVGDFTNVRTRELTGALWNCTDILPGPYRQFVDLPDQPQVFTYAQAARRIRRLT